MSILEKTFVFQYSLMLVQSPPALPTLGIAWLAAKYHGASLIIDWHNLGFTILAESHNVELTHSSEGLMISCAAESSSSLVKRSLVELYRKLELRLGKLADAHLCVSASMQQWLEEFASKISMYYLTGQR